MVFIYFFFFLYIQQKNINSICILGAELAIHLIQLIKWLRIHVNVEKYQIFFQKQIRVLQLCHQNLIYCDNIKHNTIRHRLTIKYKKKKITKNILEEYVEIKQHSVNIMLRLLGNAKKSVIEKLISDITVNKNLLKLLQCDECYSTNKQSNIHHVCYCGMRKWCNYCGKHTKKRYKKCSGCANRYFCSRNCQKKYWVRYKHRLFCDN